MNEIDFKIWLSNNNFNKKMQSDIISRIKRIEREMSYCDIDEQYRSNKCEKLIYAFSNMGNNEEMAKYKNANFPLGKYSMNTYKYAIKKYVLFMDEAE